MKAFVINAVKIFAYYILLFALCRAVFLLYYIKEVLTAGNLVFLKSLFYALPLDISAACYLLFIPLVLLLIERLSGWLFINTIIKGYLVITSLLVIALAIVEIGVYREMHIKLYFGLLFHIEHIDELMSWVSIPLLITGFAVGGVLIYVSIVAVSKLLPAKGSNPALKWGQRLLVVPLFALAAALAIIGCRGGLQAIPINEGEVYFSQVQAVNDATVNPLWNITHSYIESRKIKQGNIYKVMDDSEARNIIADLYKVNTDSATSILKTNRPNVCFLILEGWSAEVVQSLGGYSGLTPHFEEIIKDGYLFTNITSSGHVSDQGIAAVLSGYPALPFGAVINHVEKANKLPNINKPLKKEGYYSTFFYGGQLIYGGLKSYMYNAGFNHVYEQKSFPADLPAGRMGIHDSLMLDIWKDSLAAMPQPFFSGLFTVSTHSPFDAPMPRAVDWGDMENNYLNTIVYADRQIGKFFAEIKKQPWYDNTVLVLISDHSHNVPKNYRYDTREYYRIPLLIAGGALKNEYRGKRNGRIGSQIDAVNTVLIQMQLNTKDFIWGKDLLNETSQQFAFYTFNEGYGFIDTAGVVIWNKKNPHFSANITADPSRKSQQQKKGEAMLQVLIDDFIQK